MIKRIVKLTIKEGEKESYIATFHKNKKTIVGFEGCSHVESWQAVYPKNVFFTYSFWDSDEALNNYRNSDFFKKVWTNLKPKFSAKAEAWSVNVLEEKIETNQQ